MGILGVWLSNFVTLSITVTPHKGLALEVVGVDTLATFIEEEASKQVPKLIVGIYVLLLHISKL